MVNDNFKVFFITRNPHKALEAKKILEREGIKVEWVKMEYKEIQANNLRDIVAYGLEQLEKKIDKYPFFIEDAGLFIDALNGFPGPYSAYVFKTIGSEGIIKLMRNVKNRRAKFISVIGLKTSKNTESLFFTGICEGNIADRIRGEKWGFDPIFEPNECKGKTFSELGEEKNRVSHRGKSLRKMAEYLKAIRNNL